MPGNTYHCLCSELLLYTPHKLSDLPRRADPALDHALILPMKESLASGESHGPGNSRASVFLARKADLKALVVRRSDGFEKRWLRKCTRCGLVVGYELTNEADGGAVEGSASILYLLDGALRPTKEL